MLLLVLSGQDRSNYSENVSDPSAFYLVTKRDNGNKYNQITTNRLKEYANYAILFLVFRVCRILFEVHEMSEIISNNWISIDEAAAYLGVKPVTIRDWIRKEKGIPAHKIGKQWKFKISELDAWVKSGKSAME